MKAILTRKIDNTGIIVGRLKNENTLLYENEDGLNEILLTGNIIETQYNDIVAIGILHKDENEFEVIQMESLLTQNDTENYYFLTNVEHNLYATILKNSTIKEINTRYNKNGGRYTELMAEVDKNIYIHFNINAYKDINELRTDNLVIFGINPYETRSEEYGKGYAVRKTTHYYCGYVIQILS